MPEIFFIKFVCLVHNPADKQKIKGDRPVVPSFCLNGQGHQNTGCKGEEQQAAKLKNPEFFQIWHGKAPCQDQDAK